VGELVYLSMEEFNKYYGSFDFVEYDPKTIKCYSTVVAFASQPVYELEWMLLLDGFEPLSYSLDDDGVCYIAVFKK
jgi:hypothetical protein